MGERNQMSFAQHSERDVCRIAQKQQCLRSLILCVCLWPSVGPRQSQHFWGTRVAFWVAPRRSMTSVSVPTEGAGVLSWGALHAWPVHRCNTFRLLSFTGGWKEFLEIQWALFRKEMRVLGMCRWEKPPGGTQRPSSTCSVKVPACKRSLPRSSGTNRHDTSFTTPAMKHDTLIPLEDTLPCVPPVKIVWRPVFCQGVQARGLSER